MKIFRIFFISILLFSYLLAGELIKIEIFGLKHLNKEKLLEQIGAKEDDSFIFWRKEGYWIDRKFLEMLKPTIKGWLEENGYYKAKIDIEKSKDLVKVYIKENRPIRVKEIKVDSDIDVTNIVTFKVGDIFSAKKFIDIKGKLKEYLLNKGYCNYKLDTKAYVDLEKFSAKLRYFIRHNDICHFGKTTIIKKPKNIPDRVIYSRLYMQKGKKFTLERIKKSYEALNSLNLFSQIDITYDKNGSIIYPKVAVEKNSKLKRYMLAFGYESEVGFRFKGEHEWRNFLGWRNLKIKMEISKDVQKYEANYFEPAFFAIDNKYFFDLYSSLGYIKEDVSGYFMKKFYWDLHLKYNYERWDVKAGVGFEKLILDLKEEIPNLIDGNFYILYPYIQLTYDARDSKIDPKNGYYLSAYWEYGVSTKEGGSQYLKYILEGRLIHTWGDLTLAAVAKGGFIHLVSGKLPASKLFYGGGLYSNRAYGKNELGVTLSNKLYKSIGGLSWLNFSLEADYKIYKNFYGAIFWDATMISEKEYDTKGDFIHAVGVGVRYKTPIGPFKVDIGVNPNKPSDYGIFLTLGQSF